MSSGCACDPAIRVKGLKNMEKGVMEKFFLSRANLAGHGGFDAFGKF